VSEQHPVAWQRATEGDMNFIRRAWMQDVRDAADIRLRIRDAVLASARVYVARPAGVPEDTVAAFLVQSGGLVHWYGVKRAWRGLQLTHDILLQATHIAGGEPLRFARYATQEQKRFLEERGWVYAPRMEVLLAS
jgi:hypothetical protein